MIYKISPLPSPKRLRAGRSPLFTKEGERKRGPLLKSGTGKTEMRHSITRKAIRFFPTYSLFLQDQNKFFATLAAVLRIDDIFCPAMPTDNYFI